jgi:NAD(P)-dependent dehydrogenase (short-subunit alcohol dehydrogenase family)
MMSRLGGRTVFITGAARGIGEHVARVVAARGGRPVLAGLEPDRLAALGAELDCPWFECDVTDQAALQAAVTGAAERTGGIDAVVANAGIANLGTVAVGPAEALVRVIDVNLNGVIRTVSATLPYVVARRGYVLLISSAAAFTAMPGMAAYCASKAGVEQFGNVLRLETHHLGVAVGTAHPIWVDTDMVRDAQADLPSFRGSLAKLPWPLNRTVDVTECAETFVRAIENRKRRVYVPGAIGGVSALRSVMLSPLADLAVRRRSRDTVPRMEAEVRALGRSFGTHSVGNWHG